MLPFSSVRLETVLLPHQGSALRSRQRLFWVLSKGDQECLFPSARQISPRLSSCVLPLCNIQRYQYNRTHHRTGGVGPSLPQTLVSTVRRKRILSDSVEQIVLALRKLRLTFSFFVSGSSLSVKMYLSVCPVSSRKHSLGFCFVLETALVDSSGGGSKKPTA